MKDLITEMKKIGIDGAFLRIGLDFDSLFPQSRGSTLTEVYRYHEWIVKEVFGYGVVVNAVPSDEKLEVEPWEEWYAHENRIHHHVLYLREPERFDEVFEAPEQDEVHPPRTLGKSWWVVDDPDPRPVLIR